MAYRRPVDDDDDDDGFSSKFKNPEKKAETSRKELLGVSGKRVPKATANRAAKGAIILDDRPPPQHYQKPDGYDEYSDNPLARQEQKELEYLAVKKSKEVTSDLRNALKISEDTVGIGAQTLVTLKEQGDQIARTHEKVVTVDQELKKGEKLMGQLGPIFSFGWKPKKGKKITGPSYAEDNEGNSGDPSARGQLTGGMSSRPARERGQTGTYMDDVEAERADQDDLLDDVSKNLDAMKSMALAMGNEMKKQDKALDDLTTDVGELQKRQDDVNKRGRRLLGKRG
eukprot:TRINITY_DN27121_c0_g1_i1.p1 TRINITY_DN27121_c0_g1~~TRINITY_DN27121_c0_g1_i1.p1  ORF type:complete len:284 (+),score=78.31 TRINITY_DN27121_c0_g1_i1:553-1404(+)